MFGERGCNPVWFEETTRTDVTASLFPRIRANELDTPTDELLEVILGRLVSPHLLIHCRRHHDRRWRGQRHRSQQVVRSTLREPGDDICGPWGDHHQISPAGQLNVTHPGLGRFIKQFAMGRFARQRLQCERRDKFLCTP